MNKEFITIYTAADIPAGLPKHVDAEVRKWCGNSKGNHNGANKGKETKPLTINGRTEYTAEEIKAWAESRIANRAEAAKQPKPKKAAGKRGRVSNQDKALALLKALADAQGVSIEELQKQLAEQVKTDAKERCEKLQKQYSDAVKAVKDHEAYWSEVFAEHKRLMEASEKAAETLKNYKHEHGFK